MNNQINIDPVDLMLRFGDRRAEAAVYVREKYSLKLREAVRIVDDIYTQNPNLLSEIWNPTKVVGTYFQVDDNSKRWAITTGIIKPQLVKIYNYSDILDFELIEDGDTITKGGLGRAIAGGVLFGGVGAVVGGVTGGKKTKKVVNSLSIKVTTKNPDDPVAYIKFITAKTKTSSLTYKEASNCAQETLSILSQIVSQSEADIAPPEGISPADEIRKYKSLLDDGIITEEEFSIKKKELLGL